MAVDVETRGRDTWTRFREYVGEVRAEMKKVTWPNKQEIYSTTVMVILTTFLFAGYFAICDSAFQVMVSRILNHFLHRG
jgi:preprotein translocase subunit SecE